MFNIPDLVVLLMCSYKPNQHPASGIVHQHYDSVLVTADCAYRLFILSSLAIVLVMQSAAMRT